jgi:hypothetical protein
MGHYAEIDLQILLLALTVLGLVLNVLSLVLMVAVFLMYRKAMGYSDLFENASKLSEEGSQRGAPRHNGREEGHVRGVSSFC